MARRILTEFDASTAPFNRGVARIDQRLDRFNRDVSRRLDRFDSRFAKSARAVTQLQTAISALVVGTGVRGLGRLADASTRIDNRLAAIGATSDEARAKLRDLSLETRSNFEANAQLVARFTKATGDGFDANIERIRTLNKLLAVAGATTQERNSTSLQFSQALQAGQLGGEELRALRENAPIELLRAIAEAAGGTIEELKKLGAEGRLNTDVMVRALENLSSVAETEFRKVDITIAEGVTNVRTGMTEFIGGLDEGSGASEALAEALDTLGTLLADSGEGAKQLGAALVTLGQIVLAIAGARGFGALTRALFANVAARKAAAAAALDERNAAVAAQAAALQEVGRRQSAIRAAEREGASKANLIRLEKQLAQARIAAGAAADRTIAATGALTAANTAATASLGTFAAGVRNAGASLLRFVGGPLGLAFIVYTLLPDFASASETSKDAVEEFSTAVDALDAAQRGLAATENELIDANRALEEARIKVTEAVAAGGDAAIAAAQKEEQAAARTAKALATTAEVRQANINLRLIEAEAAQRAARAALAAEPEFARLNPSVRAAQDRLTELQARRSAQGERAAREGTGVTEDQIRRAERAVDTAILESQANLDDLVGVLVDAAANIGSRAGPLPVSNDVVRRAVELRQAQDNLEAQRAAAKATEDLLQQVAFARGETSVLPAAPGLSTTPATQSDPPATDSAALRNAERLTKAKREAAEETEKLRLAEQALGDFRSQEDQSTEARLRRDQNAVAVRAREEEALAQARSQGFGDAEAQAFAAARAEALRASLVRREVERAIRDRAQLNESAARDAEREAERASEAALKRSQTLAEATQAQEFAERRLAETRRELGGFEGQDTAERRQRIRDAELRAEQAHAEALAEARRRNFSEADAAAFAAAEKGRTEATLQLAEAKRALAERERAAATAARDAAAADEEARRASSRRSEQENRIVERLEESVEISRLKVEREEREAEVAGKLTDQLIRLRGELAASIEVRDAVIAKIRQGIEVTDAEVASMLRLARAREEANAPILATAPETEIGTSITIENPEAERLDEAAEAAGRFARELVNATDKGEVLKQKFLDIAADLIEIAAKQLVSKAFDPATTSGSSGGGGFLGSLFSSVLGSLFMGGGFTGYGGRMEPAGIVHRGEFVINAEQTRKHRELLEAINSGRGFANGGFVGPPSLPGIPATPRVQPANSPISYRGGDLIVQGNVTDDVLPRLEQMLNQRDANLRVEIPAIVGQRNRDDPRYLG